jgi:hypothetical protein
VRCFAAHEHPENILITTNIGRKVTYEKRW